MTVGVNDEIPVHVNGSMDGPKLLNNVQPTFTELARARRYSGDVELYLWVEKDGSVSHVKIVKAVGLGLDEAAIAAVKKYRFSPAFQNGSPVTVDIEIDVNFQIF
jgi:protein TonB